jgi:hypothetical protein
MDHFPSSGVDKAAAGSTRRKVPGVRELPNVQNNTFGGGGFGPDSLLLTEDITLRLTSLIIIRGPPNSYVRH